MRPKPNILFTNTDRSYTKTFVLEAEAVYAVFYDGRPISLMSEGLSGGPKYQKTCYPHPGFAHNLAERLNETYRTDRFTVHKLVTGDEHIECEATKQKNINTRQTRLKRS